MGFVAAGAGALRAFLQEEHSFSFHRLCSCGNKLVPYALLAPNMLLIFSQRSPIRREQHIQWHSGPRLTDLSPRSASITTFAELDGMAVRFSSFCMAMSDVLMQSSGQSILLSP